MKIPGRTTLLLLVCAGLILLTGCPKEPTRVQMIMNASPDLNPDPSGQALSVVVRIYQLKDKGRLETADYNAVWRSERETLSDDLLDRQERILQPGTQEMLEIRANPMAGFIGVVALFRNPTGDTWRRIVPVGKGKTQKITISLRQQGIDVVSTSR